MHEILALPYKLDATVRERVANVKLVGLTAFSLMASIDFGIITGRTSKLVEKRATRLGIKHAFQGCKERLSVFQKLLSKLRIEPAGAAFVGDDLIDIAIMLKAGLAVTVNAAHWLVQQYEHWVTPSSGVQGAVRELCEGAMHAQGRYSTNVQRYL